KLNYLCSIQLAKKSWNYLPKYGLKHLAEYHDIQFKHHRAGDDAEACARISLLAFEKLFLTSNDEVSDYMKQKIKAL
ncbi:DNA polymerase III subunit epsilon, partial [Chryseobacterium sp. 2TAF14]